MSLLTMRLVPDGILREKAKKIGKIPANMRRYTEDLVETMHSQNGVGLAANQVGSLQKVAVIQLPDWDEPLVLINPEIVRREGEREIEEGCLSIPGYRGTVTRSERVRARALDLNGKVVRIRAEGLLAQALEHETDHLNGILYIDHLVSRDSLRRVGCDPTGGDSGENGDESGSPAESAVAAPGPSDPGQE